MTTIRPEPIRPGQEPAFIRLHLSVIAADFYRPR